MLISVPAVAWAESAVPTADAILAEAYRQHSSDLQIEGQGKVVKLLPDDNQGSRHQRFIIRLDSGQTLLIAHNIDLAPKIQGLRVGDEVSFFGEYEWSKKGGTLHWTHRDPGGRHVDGWLRHAGRMYQ
ncbi:MAG: DUF3465 domain-containing protein [Gammaproteobacteria bacterium]